MKNKRKHVLLLMTMLCMLAGVFFTRSRIQLPQNPRKYEQKTHEDGYAYLTYEDKIFVPYCPYETEYLGECIGYYDIQASENAGAGRAYVCEMKGYSCDEWIIDVLDTGCPEGMIFKEVNAARIPDGLTSEYEWNR